ncbi:MAG: hypothetical protein V3T23_10030, partial [Nitrososphaerales archaeon]
SLRWAFPISFSPARNARSLHRGDSPSGLARRPPSFLQRLQPRRKVAVTPKEFGRGAELVLSGAELL